VRTVFVQRIYDWLVAIDRRLSSDRGQTVTFDEDFDERDATALDAALAKAELWHCVVPTDNRFVISVRKRDAASAATLIESCRAGLHGGPRGQSAPRGGAPAGG
jgi:hypothetical protein